MFVTNIALPGKLSKKSKKITTWYVCTVSCGTEIFGTAASQPKANGDVVFDEEFEIKTRSYNFEITITIYAMTLPNYKEVNLIAYALILQLNYCLRLIILLTSNYFFRSPTFCVLTYQEPLILTLLVSEL